MRPYPPGPGPALSLRRRRPRVALAFAGLSFLSAGLSACGARSPLAASEITIVSAEGGGAGGGSGLGGGGSGQAGSGQGGALAPFVCPGLQLEGAPRAIETDKNADHQEILLSLLGGSQDTVFAGVIQPAMFTEHSSLRLISFPGWGPWPDSFSPQSSFSYEVLPGKTLLSGGRAPGSLALAFSRLSPELGVGILPQATEEDSGIAFFSSKPIGLSVPQSLASLGSFILEVDETAATGHVSVLRRLGTVDEGGAVVQLGCGTTSLVASIAPVGQDALIAYSSVGGDCIAKNPTKSAGMLRIARAQGSIAHANSLDLPASPLANEDDHLQFLRLAANERGAWVVYQYEGENALVPGPYMAIPLDLEGNPRAPAKLVLGANASILPPAVTVFGDRLVLAYAPAVGSQQTGFSIDMWSPEGQLSNIYSIDEQVGGFTGRATLLAGPKNDYLLVGWTETTPVHHQGYLARISCYFP